MTPAHHAAIILKTDAVAGEAAFRTVPELFEIAKVFRAEERRARRLKLVAVELARMSLLLGLDEMLDPATIDEATFLRLIAICDDRRKKLFSENWEHVTEILNMVREARAIEAKETKR